MPRVRQQPQGRAQLNRARSMFAGALAVIHAPSPVNIATGVPYATSNVFPGTLVKQGTPAGVALPFRKNWYLETETLPAIGTADFTEFWIGYPSADIGASGNTAEPGFITGSSTDSIGICATLGSTRSQMGGNGDANCWGTVYNWPQLYSANDYLTNGELNIVAVVRRGATMEFWRAGVRVNTVGGSQINLGAATLLCGSFVENSYWTTSSNTMLAGRVLGAWAPEELRAFTSSVSEAYGMLFAPTGDDGDQPASSVTRTLTAETGAFSVAGASAGLRAARRLPASAGALALTGVAAGLMARRRLPAAPATFTLTGNTAGLTAARRLPAVAGAFALAGASASLRAARSLQAGAGAFSVGGVPAGLRLARRLVAAPAAFALTGNAVTLTYQPAPGPGGPTYTLSAASGTFALAGAGAALRAHRLMPAAAGNFALVGAGARLLARRTLPAAPGAFALLGAPVALKYSGSPGLPDASTVPLSRRVVFAGGTRVVAFEGGQRVVEFEGGIKTVRF